MCSEKDLLSGFAGNDEIKTVIRNAVKSGRFPHAFIIEGESGSGRYTLAKMIAAAAVCKEENAPCGKCRRCELVMNNAFADVYTYSPDGATFKVDTVRSIRDGAFVMPIEAERKVCILKDCDKMNEPAQNAFLKILEEPPSFMVFILICENAASLLATVRSRCVTLSVSLPEYETAAEYAAQVSGKPQTEAAAAVKASHCNIGKALKILAGDKNTAAILSSEFISAMYKKDRFAAIKTVKELEKDRQLFSSFLSELELGLAGDLKSAACGGGLAVPMRSLSLCLDTVRRYSDLQMHHVGQPLLVSLLSTAMTAEIFENL